MTVNHEPVGPYVAVRPVVEAESLQCVFSEDVVDVKALLCGVDIDGRREVQHAGVMNNGAASIAADLLPLNELLAEARKAPIAKKRRRQAVMKKTAVSRVEAVQFGAAELAEERQGIADEANAAAGVQCLENDDDAKTILADEGVKGGVVDIAAVKSPQGCPEPSLEKWAPRPDMVAFLKSRSGCSWDELMTRPLSETMPAKAPPLRTKGRRDC